MVSPAAGEGKSVHRKAMAEEARAKSFFAERTRLPAIELGEALLVELRQPSESAAYARALVVELANKIFVMDAAAAWSRRIGSNFKTCLEMASRDRSEFFRLIGATDVPPYEEQHMPHPKDSMLLWCALSFLEGGRRTGVVGLAKADGTAQFMQPFLFHRVVGVSAKRIRLDPPVFKDGEEGELDVYAQVMRRNQLWREEKEGQGYQVMHDNVKLAQAELAAKRLMYTAHHYQATVAVGWTSVVPDKIRIAQDKECHLLVVGPRSAALKEDAWIDEQQTMEWRLKLDSEHILANRQTSDGLYFPIVETHRLDVSGDDRSALMWLPLFMSSSLLVKTSMASMRESDLRLIDVKKYAASERFFEDASAWKGAVEKGLLALLSSLLNRLLATVLSGGVIAAAKK